ncbi:MAG: addiction module protein [Sulfuricurvum sp.]|nr:addiction module protein [Sulfuricurvum sp.]
MFVLNTNQLLTETDSISLDLKTKLLEALWKQQIDKRIGAIEGGTVSLIDGNEVFQKIKKRFA